MLRTFGENNTQSDSSIAESDDSEGEKDTIDLEMKKNFFYVISPDSEVVDCAKIYSFLHEDNIYKRIIARVNKHVDSKINMGD